MRLAIPIAVLMVALLTGARAHSDTALEMGPISPATEAVEQTADRARALHCKTPDCVALMTIDDTFGVINQSMATTVGVTRPLPIARPARINRLFRVRLLSHPERFAAICARSVDLASQFGRDSDLEPDPFLSTSIILIAYLMDSTGHGQCLSAVLAAFPHLPTSDVAIANARDICGYRHWAKASCDSIRR
jgi:hypothetical protein